MTVPEGSMPHPSTGSQGDHAWQTSVVTVHDVLDLGALDGASFTGPAGCLDRPVRSVTVVELSSALTAAIPAYAVVLVSVPAQRPRWTHVLDMLVRRAASSGAPVIVAPRPTEPLSASVHRVAARLGVGVVLHDGDPAGHALGIQLELAVGHPDLLESRALAAVAASDPNRPARQALSAVSAALAAQVALFDGRGRRLGSDELVTTIAELTTVTSPSSWHVGDSSVVALPLRFGHEPAWLVAEREQAGPRWMPFAQRALALVRGEMIALLAIGRLEAERVARIRGLVLNDIESSAPGPQLASAAEGLGWELSGWHVGFHLTVDGDPPLALWELDGRIAAAVDDGIPLRGAVERSDGWAFWADLPQPLDPTGTSRLVTAVHRAVDTLRHDAPGRSIVLGVGTAQPHGDGLTRTLQEARNAAGLAAASPAGTSVRAVQDLGASELLVGWYRSPLVRDAAGQTLAPLAGEHDVLQTLETYLERACSAAQTARVLGVHRNSVTQRLAKAERLLGVSLTSADTRLALQLALRARHAETRPTPSPPGR